MALFLAQVFNLLAFENKICTAYDRSYGNVPYGKIPTKKEPIITFGVTSRLPCHIIIIGNVDRGLERMNEGLIYGQSFFEARIFGGEGGALVCRRLDVMSAACRREVEGALRGILPPENFKPNVF